MSLVKLSRKMTRENTEEIHLKCIHGLVVMHDAVENMSPWLLMSVNAALTDETAVNRAWYNSYWKSAPLDMWGRINRTEVCQ